MRYIPNVDDIDPEMAVELAIGETDLEQLASKMKTTGQHLTELLQGDNPAADLIRSVREEFQAIARMRLMLMASEAMDTLEDVMRDKGNDKTSGPRVKAAEVALDRGGFPKISRNSQSSTGARSNDVLPDLNTLLAEAEPGQTEQIVTDYLEVMKRIDEIRHGARQIIEVKGDNGSS